MPALKIGAALHGKDANELHINCLRTRFIIYCLFTKHLPLQSHVIADLPLPKVREKSRLRPQRRRTSATKKSDFCPTLPKE